MAVKADFREAEADVVSVQGCLWRPLQGRPGVCKVLMTMTVLFLDIASALLKGLLLKKIIIKKIIKNVIRFGANLQGILFLDPIAYVGPSVHSETFWSSLEVSSNLLSTLTAQSYNTIPVQTLHSVPQTLFAQQEVEE